VSVLDEWVLATKAHKRVKRSRSAIYAWLQRPELEIRTLRVDRYLWLNVNDLLRVEKEMTLRKYATRRAREL